MIKIRIFSAEDGTLTGFSVTGHSGTAEHGHDIVCAGVSSVTLTAALGLDEYLHRKVHVEEASGKLKVRLEERPDERTEAILRTMLLGLRAIAAQYPDAVRILP